MAVPDRSLLAQAEAALRLAATDPRQVAAAAGAILQSADRDGVARSIAERALGVALRAEGDLQSARAHLSRSLAVAMEAGLHSLAAESRVALAAVAAAQGATDESLCLLAEAATVLRGPDAARLELQRAVVLQRLGRIDEAFAGYGRALVLLRQVGDPDGQARALSNRGVLLAYRGEFALAEQDLLAAEPMLLGLGHHLDTASVHHNLGFVAARRGDVPAALRWFDQAEREWRDAGCEHPEALLDRGETLLAVRLVGEARAVAATAVAQLEASGAEADLAEARVLLSQAALLDGDATDARRQAVQAQAAFVAQDRPGWAALARYAGLRASWVAREGGDALAAEAIAAVEDLVAAGWTVPASEARLIAARVAVDAGRPDEADEQLRLASQARFTGPADVRARAWHAEALVRRARGDGRGAEAALRAGIRVLDRNRATLGATELRVHAAARVTDLGQLGMRMALESGRARRVLTWAERLRADWARSRRPPRPPDDGEVANHLAELRHVVGQLEAAGFAGHDPGRLLRRQAALEAQIRRTTRHAAAGVEAGDDPELPSVADISAALDGRALVELVECDGALAAVTLVDGEARLHRLRSVAEASEAAGTLRFALGRLARAVGSQEAQRAAAELAEAASGQLEDLLFGPLRRRLHVRPLVIVPTAALHALPWSSIPGCLDRAVTVAPSAAAWFRAVAPAGAQGDGPAGAGTTVLVAGPDLAHAADELAELARVHVPATSLVGRSATVANVLRAVDGAGLVHVAAHGHFRADNPLLSSLRLADGPLTVYDLERLHRAPRLLVLSACEGGLSAAHPGDELLGLASTLLCLGTRSLVASVVPVGDATARVLMVDLHRRLAAGRPPAEALAAAMGSARRSPVGGLAAAGFVCFGAG